MVAQKAASGRRIHPNAASRALRSISNLASEALVASGNNAIETTLRILNEEASFTQAYTLQDQTFDVRAKIRKGESELSTGLPPTFTNYLFNRIVGRIDLRLDTIEIKRINYLDAFEGYKLYSESKSSRGNKLSYGLEDQRAYCILNLLN